MKDVTLVFRRAEGAKQSEDTESTSDPFLQIYNPECHYQDDLKKKKRQPSGLHLVLNSSRVVIGPDTCRAGHILSQRRHHHQRPPGTLTMCQGTPVAYSNKYIVNKYIKLLTTHGNMAPCARTSRDHRRQQPYKHFQYWIY